MKLKAFCALFLFSAYLNLHATDIAYTVEFEGICNADILTTLESVSELVILKNSPPSTTTALHRRAEADIRNLVQGLHSFGYYNSKIDIDIEDSIVPATIRVHVDLGPIYPLESFKIVAACEDENNYDFETITLPCIGICLGEPALPKNICDAEAKILQLLSKQGYPLARIIDTEVLADQATKSIYVTIKVDVGKQVCFGPISISGLQDVDECAIKNKIAWSYGEQYNPILIEDTLNDIEASGLFSSVLINTPDEASEENLLAMNIEVLEAKHRTIGGGVSYNTQLGPGIIGIWEHRNMRNMGEKLKLHADIAQKRQTGTILYAQPDFLTPKQDLLWVTEFESEQTRGFSDTAFSFSGIIDRELCRNTKISYGGTIKQLHTENSNNNNQFILLKIPFLFRWSSANSLLDPTRGNTINFRMTPTTQLNQKVFYAINTLTGTGYYSLTSTSSIVLAAKLSLGSIWGSSDIRIPPPERFYLGSESTLRGYNYLTVSPLDAFNDPIGGRSMMVAVGEFRWRVAECFGIVGFYEVGNAYLNILPQIFSKQLQSIGLGLRYHTAVGPLRFDIAFPLNRRQGIDRAFQFYFSIGQSF